MQAAKYMAIFTFTLECIWNIQLEKTDKVMIFAILYKLKVSLTTSSCRRFMSKDNN